MNRMDSTIHKPTVETFEPLQQAFDWFNHELFDDSLPQCLILLHRKRQAAGYFWGDQFSAVNGAGSIDEISLNPTLLDRPEIETLSTLVHEMVHQWQHHYGNPSRRAYHNREWANKMEEVGLQPSDTGEPGGRRIGQRMTHYIIPGGPFERSYETLQAKGFLKWSAMKQTPIERGKRKTKFTCPKCRANAWGKPELNIICGECSCEMVSS